MRARQRRRAGLGAAVLALVLGAACSGDGTAQSVAPSGGGSSAAGAAGAAASTVVAANAATPTVSSAAGNASAAGAPAAPAATASGGFPALRALPATRVAVASEPELRAAIDRANASGGGVTLVLADGLYALTDTLYVSAPDVALVSASNDRSRVVLRGDAMSASARVKNLIRVSGRAFQLRGITLERAGWHLIQIAGESDADDPVIADCAMRDSWEQMLKVSYDATRPTVGSDRGIVQNCLFEYTAGIGPQYYIGGVDAHAASDWVVRGNVFRNIASPSRAVAEHAIHFWSQSRNTLVERNLIVDSDRGIGFGLGDRGHVGGVIRNNFIHHTANAHPFADAGIILENSPGTVVVHNTILQEHAYPRAIEYRFAGTTGVTIANNLTSRPIAARDGGTATLRSNVTAASRSMFRLSVTGDLRLAGPVPGVVDAAAPIDGLLEDFEGGVRPKGAGADIGAHEL